MNAQALELRLRALRLPSFVEHYAGLAEQAASGGWTHVRYLAELAAVESQDRHDRRIARLRQQAKLPRDKTLATLDAGRFPGAVRTQLARLAEVTSLEVVHVPAPLPSHCGQFTIRAQVCN